MTDSEIRANHFRVALGRVGRTGVASRVEAGIRPGPTRNGAPWRLRRPVGYSVIIEAEAVIGGSRVLVPADLGIE